MSNYTYTKKEEYLPLEEGEYEAKVEKVEFKESQSGNQYISLQLRIRDDVEQKGKNRIVFDTIFKDKENPNLYDSRKINKYLGTQDVKEGTEFNTIDDVLKVINGSFLKVNLKIRHNDYMDREENFIYYYSPSNAVSKLVDTPSEAIDITENDLPF